MKLALLSLMMVACVDTQDADDRQPDADAVAKYISPIIGGVADSGDPGVVAVVAFSSDLLTIASVCTGAVISPHVILTAAHCLDPRTIGANRALYMFTGAAVGAPGATLSPIAGVAIPPGYDPANQSTIFNGNDIALATLADAAPVPSIPYVHGLPSVNVPVRIIGYGSNAHDNTGAGTKRQGTAVIANTQSPPGQFFLGNPNGVQACHGDSGGPALQILGGVETIIGVASQASDSATSVCNGGFASYTRVDLWTSFLDSVVF